MEKFDRYIADFDSTTSMLVSVSNFLHGKGLPGGGVVPNAPKPAAWVLNHLPANFRRSLYRWSGWYDAFSYKKLKDIDSEEISKWVVEKYPKRRYPAVMIGSPSGSGAHICAALGIPYLPQTFLLPVRRHLDPDDLIADLCWGRAAIQPLIENNPDLQVHQMHDPVQDRLMVERMAYFRIKKKTLGKVYLNFLKNNLVEGGTIFILECDLKWPATRVNSDHYFQCGGFGALDTNEIFDGSKRIEEFLKEHNPKIKKWDLPRPDVQLPEAEWGFIENLKNDICRRAEENSWNTCRIIYKNPDNLSPFVAELYRWWYEMRNIKAERILIECFALLDPWWALLTGSVPYWLAFNTKPSKDILADYLKKSGTFKEAYIMLMSNGIKSIGLVSVEEWKELLSETSLKYSFLGMDEKEYPLDLGSFGRYFPELQESLKTRFEMPESLSISELNKFLEISKDRFPVRWINGNV